jgi:hypothetical protein
MRQVTYHRPERGAARPHWCARCARLVYYYYCCCVIGGVLAQQPCPFTDTDGDPWDLSSLGGIQTTTGGGGPTTGVWNYQFNACENVNPINGVCTDQGILGTVAARNDGTIATGVCEQLGPDINLDRTNVVATKTDTGVDLKWTYLPFVGNQKSFTLSLSCGPDGTPSPAIGAPDDPEVSWEHTAVCPPDPGNPGGGAPPGFVPAGGGSSWGWWFIGFSLAGTALYLGGGVYLRRRERPELSLREALPHPTFWKGVSTNVACGVHLSRAKASTLHPSLSFLAPGDDYRDLDDVEGGAGSGVTDDAKMPLTKPSPAGATPTKKNDKLKGRKAKAKGKGKGKPKGKPKAKPKAKSKPPPSYDASAE